MIKIITFLNKIFFFAFVVLMFLMMNARSLEVDKVYGAYTDCINCFRWWVLSNDAKIVIFAVVILLLSLVIKSYVFRFFMRLFTVIFLCYYGIDLYLFKSLSQRLFIQDIYTYLNADAINEVVVRGLGSYTTVFLMLLSVIVFIYLFLHRKIVFKMYEKVVIGLILASLLGLLLFPNKIDYINDVAIRNIVEINYKSKAAVNYSQDTIDKVRIEEIEALNCDFDGLGKKKNIILVILESFSNYQSELFSGINNWTPMLDEIAKQNRYFPHFHANNFTSLEGRLAILTGEKTFRDIATFGLDRGRVGYWNTQRNLPKLLKSKGYYTSFLDGADLGFTRTGEFMRGIGYDYVEGQEYVGYKNKPRFGFNSVSDEVLYNRVLDYTKTSQHPYFITVITVTTHPPYINPLTNEKSIEQATKYADKALHDFYQELEKNSFFENGLLIITSDHRSMRPVSLQELKRYGKQAVSAIPLIVVDKDYEGQAENTEYLQQSDLLNSIDYYISEKHCRRKGEGNILSVPAVPAQCVYHNRGDSREQIEVYCNNGAQHATIELNGDATQVIDGYIAYPKKIINLINTSRIGAKKRHQEFLFQQKNN